MDQRKKNIKKSECGADVFSESSRREVVALVTLFVSKKRKWK